MRAGIYARISKDAEGTELGVTRQQDDCRAEAERRGWEVVSVYTDNDVSATRSKVRPEYQRMLSDVEAGHIQAIVVWSIDRLTRTPRELEDILDLAKTTGLRLANVRGEIDLATSQGVGMARMLGTFARMETEAMSSRLKRKFEEKAAAGEPHGYAPYGFTRVPVLDGDGNPVGSSKRDVVNEEEAEVVREAARRVLGHESLRSIITDLNARGIDGPKVKSWNSTILRQILQRPTNAGLRRHRGKVIGKSNGEAIYDVETHERLVALLNDPSRRSNFAGATPKYLLSGIARCGRPSCGGVMRRLVGRVVTTKAGTKRQPPAYGCSVCFRCRRKQSDVDSVVTEVLIARLSRPDALRLFPTGDADAAQEAQLALDAGLRKLEVAADQFADDVITGAQLKRITTKVRTDMARAEVALREAQPSSALSSLVGGDVRAKWAALPLAGQREAVETLVSVVIMPSGSGRSFNRDDVVIEWKGEANG